MLWDSMEVVNETEQSKLGVFVLWNGIVLALKGFKLLVMLFQWLYLLLFPTGFCSFD